MTTTPDYAALCQAAGWREYTDSDVIARISGDRDGIAHAATIEGDASHNDSIYGEWRSCWLEAVAEWPPDQRQAIEEGWCVMWSDSRAIWLIQRDDEAARLPCDEAAVDHVRARAEAGSAYHRDILDLLTLVNC